MSLAAQRAGDRQLVERRLGAIGDVGVDRRADPAAEQLALAAAEKLLGDAVDDRDAPLAVDREQSLAHALGDGLRVVARVAQGGLGGDTRGDVHGHADDGGGDALIVVDEAVAHVGCEQRAFLAANEQLAVPAPVTAQLHHQQFGGRGVLGHHQFARVAADRFLGGPAVERLGAVVPGQHDARHVAGDHRRVDLVEQHRVHAVLSLALGPSRPRGHRVERGPPQVDRAETARLALIGVGRGSSGDAGQRLLALVAPAAAAVQPCVGAAGERLELIAVLRVQRDAERAGRALGERLADTRGQRPHVVGRDLRQHDGELVAAEAPDRVALADGRLERRDDPAEQFVARGVAEDVVDGLELVDVEDEDRAAAPGAAQRRELRHGALFEAAPVQAAGQRVGAGGGRERAVLALVVLRLPAAQRAGAEQAESEGDLVGEGRPPSIGRAPR